MSCLLVATSWIDVSIPLVFGLLMFLCPQWALKSTGSAEKDEARVSQIRKGGGLLLIAAGIYYFTMSFAP